MFDPSSGKAEPFRTGCGQAATHHSSLITHHSSLITRRHPSAFLDPPWLRRRADQVAALPVLLLSWDLHPIRHTACQDTYAMDVRNNLQV